MRNLRKIGGIFCLVCALLLFNTARKSAQADEERKEFLAGRLVEALKWEDEIAKMNNKITSDNVAVSNSILKDTDGAPARAVLAQDKAILADYQKIEQSMGTVPIQRAAIQEVAGHRKTVLSDYVGCGLLVGAGAVLLLI